MGFLGERDNIEVEKARAFLLSETVLKHAKFLGLVEKQRERVFAVPVDVDGTTEIFRFRRFTHEQATRITILPFFEKILSNSSLSEEEQKQWEAFQVEMLVEITIDSKKWEDVISVKPHLVPILYSVVAHFSGLSDEFQSGLKDLMNSDFGFNYGYIWFNLFHLTPSQVSQLPETDVLMVHKWFETWFKRLEENANRIRS